MKKGPSYARKAGAQLCVLITDRYPGPLGGDAKRYRDGKVPRQARRSILTGLSAAQSPVRTLWECIGYISQVLRLVRQALLERSDLLETATVDNQALLLSVRGAQPTFSSPIDTQTA